MNLKHKIITMLLLSSFIGAQMATAQAGTLPVKTINVNGYDMPYVEKGKGELLILVHGSLSDYRTWEKTMDEFSEYNHTIAVSLRHFYPAKWDGKSNDLTMQQHVDDVAALIKSLGNEKVNLVGHSRGGAVVMQVASQYPHLVKRLVLADPAPLYSMLSGKSDALAYLDKRKGVLSKAMQHYKQNNIDAGLKAFVNLIAGTNAWDRTTEDRRNSLRDNALTLKSSINDAQIPFQCADVKKITAPVLMVTGERSKAIYGTMNRRMSSCLQQSRTVTVADAGHMMYASNPTAFIFEVQDFIVPN